MDAIAFLRHDHQSVLGLLETLDGAPSGSGAAASGLETMVNNLIIAESQHEAIEEQFFWPAVRDAIGDGVADKALEQEQAGKKLLQRLEGKPGEPDYHEALQEFVKAGREHIAYEQEMVWPQVEAVLSRGDLEKIGEKLEQAKKIAPTHPPTPGHATQPRRPEDRGNGGRRHRPYARRPHRARRGQSTGSASQVGTSWAGR